MKGSFTRLGVFAYAVLGVLLLVTPVLAQSSAAVVRQPGPLSYDISKETTLTGTVSSLTTTASRGVLPGAHLMFQTSTGSVDASLGAFAMRGRGAFSAAPGDQVAVTGVMKLIKNQQIFVARLIKVNGQTYLIRNQHGMAVPPQSRERLSQSAEAKGVQP
jgi:hypothetical protein